MHTWKKSIGAAAAALLMVSGPLASAQSTPASSKLSVSGSAARSATRTENAAQMRGGFLIPAIAVVAIILGIVLLANEDDAPHSP